MVYGVRKDTILTDQSNENIFNLITHNTICNTSDGKKWRQEKIHQSDT